MPKLANAIQKLITKNDSRDLNAVSVKLYAKAQKDALRKDSASAYVGAYVSFNNLNQSHEEILYKELESINLVSPDSYSKYVETIKNWKPELITKEESKAIKETQSLLVNTILPRIHNEQQQKKEQHLITLCQNYELHLENVIKKQLRKADLTLYTEIFEKKPENENVIIYDENTKTRTEEVRVVEAGMALFLRIDAAEPNKTFTLNEEKDMQDARKVSMQVDDPDKSDQSKLTEQQILEKKLKDKLDYDKLKLKKVKSYKAIEKRLQISLMVGSDQQKLEEIKAKLEMELRSQIYTKDGSGKQSLEEIKSHDLGFKLAVEKYKAVQEMRSSLGTKKPIEGQLKDFHYSFKVHRKLIEKRRDTPAITFLKGVATFFSVGLSVAFGMWRPKGKELSNKIEREFKNPKAKP